MKWNNLSTLPKLETESCSLGINFYDQDGTVYQGYMQVTDKLFYFYSYEHRSYIQNVKGWAYLPSAPMANQNEKL